VTRAVLPIAVAIALLAGCGGSNGSTLYEGTDWRVVLKGDRAEVGHRVNGKWETDTSGAVTLEILGPKPNAVATNPPQVAVAIRSEAPLVELFLWVDGNRLIEKGGGTSTNFTMYGAPNRLDPGTHTAVAYARSASSGSAVTWKFRVS
jgi:hypothetical protein